MTEPEKFVWAVSDLVREKPEEKSKIVRITKHLPGRHDQLRHGHGTPYVDRARGIRAHAEEIEPGVTSDMKDIVGRNGGELVDLDHDLKGTSSTARKIKSKVIEDRMSPDEAAGDIKDSVRYTAIFDDDNYTAGSKATMAGLERKGYERLPVKNYWTGGGGDYKGVNTNFRTPDGTVIELQFHTPLSFKTKDPSHKLYEKSRSLKLPEPARAAAREQGRALWTAVPVPAGAGGL